MRGSLVGWTWKIPEVRQTRVDLLGISAVDSRLVGLELQSKNDARLPFRIADYALRAYDLHKEFPDQHVLYVGPDKMRMPNVLVGLNFSFRFKIIDIRDVDEESLLKARSRATASWLF